MFEIIGKYNKATIYANQTDSEAYAQVLQMCNNEELKESHIRMMPDMHASEGCTVGTSITVTDKANPSYVGGDIGCGMQVYRLSSKEIDFGTLDNVIRTLIPSGAAIRSNAHPALKKLNLDDLYCAEALKRATVERSFGTLGGGNHFIELDRDLDDNLYLVIHSGSRRLGRDVANFYQSVAFFDENGISQNEVKKKRLRPADIKDSRKKEGQCFLTGESLRLYLHDMDIAVEYARLSRILMAETILAEMKLDVEDSFSTIHNYIDTKHFILRKGAVSAQKDEQLIIPINMRDGSLICKGRGNPEWNYTAPHGSGRVMTRSDAKRSISLEEYKKSMEGIYTTSVGESTLDESPMAYRSIDEILDVIDPTAELINIITPVYNFKASKGALDEETMDGKD